MEARPVGVAMSDGTVVPFTDALGGITELADRHGSRKGAVASWWSRSRVGETLYSFPEPLFRLSLGPIWYPKDIDGYRPGNGRWAKNV
jgi:hypothetical protein